MKNLFFSSMLLFFVCQAFGQITPLAKEKFKSRYGVKVVAGLISNRPESTYLGDESGVALYEISTARTLMQTSFGMFAQKKYGFLYVDASAVYSNYGVVFDVSSISGRDETNHNMIEKFGYIDLQIMGGITSHGLRIGVGPVMHILANHSSELTHLENFSQRMRTTSYGFSSTLGYDIGIFSFDLRYDKAFRTVGDHIYYGYKKSQFHSTPDAVSFSIGIALAR
ncbi:MAG: hypothetical protein IPO92_23645 [Saprospiraceae bacterium]|nr:hypothetical protein [Saprospiraceae bacterium]